MAFVAAQEMFDYVSSTLKRASIDVRSDAPYWTPIITTAQGAAYQNIIGSMLIRGLSLAQITAWDRGPEFEKALSVFWSLHYGGCLGNMDDKFVNIFDLRRELEIVPVTNSNALQTVT